MRQRHKRRLHRFWAPIGALFFALAAFLWQHNVRPQWVRVKRSDRLLNEHFLGDWPVRQ
jgi:hypothetical protein